MPETAARRDSNEKRCLEPGCVFKDGHVYIFRDTEIMKIRGWPAPEAVIKEEDRPWRAFLPAFPLVRPYRRRRTRPSGGRPSNAVGPGSSDTRPRRDGSVGDGQLLLGLEVPVATKPCGGASSTRRLSRAQLDRLAFDRFRFSLPKAVAAVLERFETHQWHLLAFLEAFGERSLQLGAGRPVIAYLVAIDFARGLRSRSVVDGLLAMRQRDLMQELGFPPENSMVRVLERVHPGSIDPRSARLLRRAASVPEVLRALAHLPEVHAGVLGFLQSRTIWQRASNRLLLDVAADKVERHRRAAARRIAEIVALETELRREPRPRTFQSMERIIEVHDELVRLREQRRVREAPRPTRKAGASFPPPPLPATASIHPLSDEADLEEEGRVQKNCVACYAAAVRARRCYIYRITEPERCTLSIAPDSAGNWRISELEAAGNTPASTAAYRAVETWLARSRLGA